VGRSCLLKSTGTDEKATVRKKGRNKIAGLLGLFPRCTGKKGRRKRRRGGKKRLNSRKHEGWEELNEKTKRIGFTLTEVQEGGEKGLRRKTNKKKTRGHGRGAEEKRHLGRKAKAYRKNKLNVGK